MVSEQFCRNLVNGSANNSTNILEDSFRHQSSSEQAPPRPPQQHVPPSTSLGQPHLPPLSGIAPSLGVPLADHYLQDPGKQLPSISWSQENECGKRRSPSDPRSESLLTKKTKVENDVVTEEKDDSGYLTNLDASSLNLGEASFNNMIKDNVGEVNMLDDTLGLLDLSSNDIVDNMYDQLLEAKTSDVEDGMDLDDEVKVKKEVKEEELSDLRKLFYGNDVSPGYSLVVVGVRNGFNNKVREVELTDGFEVSSNFFFKIGPSLGEELTKGLRLSLTSIYIVGARICVNTYDIVGRGEQVDLGMVLTIEEEFYTKLRRQTLEDRNLFDLAQPKSLNDYIELEQSVLLFIASHGGKTNPRRILFSLSISSSKREEKESPLLAPKLAKLLAAHLEMSKNEVESFFEKRHPPIIVDLVHDHSYCELSTALA